MKDFEEILASAYAREPLPSKRKTSIRIADFTPKEPELTPLQQREVDMIRENMEMEIEFTPTKESCDALKELIGESRKPMYVGANQNCNTNKQ